MQKIKLILCLLYVNIQCLAQADIRPLNVEDSLLDTYISSSMENFYGWDSCFSGIYFIKFSLEKNGEVNDFESSESMPAPFKFAIEQKIKELKGRWAFSFLDFVSRNDKIILQPIFIDYNQECSYRENFYSKKLSLDSLDEEFSCLVAKTQVIIYSNLFLSMKETFLQTKKMENNKGFLDCILMNPCFITPKAKKWKGSKVD